MGIAESVLKIIEISLRLVEKSLADRIKNEILSLRSDYAEELGKPFDQIDDDKLYSIRLRINGIVQLYTSAIEGSDTKTKP